MTEQPKASTEITRVTAEITPGEMVLGRSVVTRVIR